MLVVANRVHRAVRLLGERIDLCLSVFRRPTSGQLKDMLVAFSHGNG